MLAGAGRLPCQGAPGRACVNFACLNASAPRHFSCSRREGMKDTSIGEREQRLLEQVIVLAHNLRDEREQLARRLTDLEQELSVLASKLDGRPAVITLASHAQH